MMGAMLRMAAAANQGGNRGESITIRFAAGNARIDFPASGVSGTLDWGDGSAPVTNPTGVHTKTLSAPVVATFIGAISGGVFFVTGPATHVDDWIEGPTRYTVTSAPLLVSVPNWLPRSVTDLTNFFNGASIFNQPLPWDTSNVSNMVNMFANATAFNQDLSGWCVSLIPTKPNNFALNVAGWPAGRQPIWGTCP